MTGEDKAHHDIEQIKPNSCQIFFASSILCGTYFLTTLIARLKTGTLLLLNKIYDAY